MRARSFLPGLVVLALVGCGGDERAATDGTDTAGAATATAPPPPPPTPIPPEELAGALDSLSSQLQRQVNAAALRLEAAHPGNETRLKTLRWRLRASEVCRRARNRDNAMAGLIELWFWTLASERQFTIGSAKDAFGDQQAQVRAQAGELVASSEHMVRRAVPPDRFGALEAKVKAATEHGDDYLSGPGNGPDPLADLLEVTKLEGLLNLALSPFDLFSGVKTGGNAAASMAVTADRAVSLLAEYPQILSWQMQAAALEVQAQDTAKSLLAEVSRSNASLEAAIAVARGLPAQVRQEGVALLDQSRPAQVDVRETLKALTEAAVALERLNAGVDRLTARLMPPADPSKPAAPPGRPFDIREYTEALTAAALTARDLQQTVAATEKLLASPAIPSRIGEADEAAHGLVRTIGLWSIALLLVLTTCVVVGVRTLRR